MTIHYTTIDIQKSKIRTHDHALHHQWLQNSKIKTHDHALHYHWPPKSLDSNPRPSIYTTITTIDLQKSKIRAQDHALRHHWPSKRQRFEPTTMHSPACTTDYTTIDHEGRSILSADILCTCTLIRFLAHTMQLVGFKLTWPPFCTS
jgi:hypothetical protein